MSLRQPTRDELIEAKQFNDLTIGRLRIIRPSLIEKRKYEDSTVVVDVMLFSTICKCGHEEDTQDVSFIDYVYAKCPACNELYVPRVGINLA